MWQIAAGDLRGAPREMRAVLFEFPVHSPADRFDENLPYMYFSMSHWAPMVNGYSGFNPPSYRRARSRALTDFRADIPLWTT